MRYGCNTPPHRRLVSVVHSMHGELRLRMVADGFAPVYPKYCREPRFYDAQANVKARVAGIWSVQGVHQTPWVWRHKQPL